MDLAVYIGCLILGYLLGLISKTLCAIFRLIRIAQKDRRKNSADDSDIFPDDCND